MKPGNLLKFVGISALLCAGCTSMVSRGATSVASHGAGPVPQARSQPAKPSAWHVVATLAKKSDETFSAVVATGEASGWAFKFGTGVTSAYERTSATTWQQAAFPSVKMLNITDAKATSSSNVWAIGSAPFQWLVLRLAGGKWSVMKTFDSSIYGESVLAPSNVWVFGNDGTYHYDGHAWLRVSSGFAAGGYALSANDAWTYDETTVTHLMGGSAKTSSLATLLRLEASTGVPKLSGVFALSDSDVYAIGDGETPFQGGPIAIYHYDGSTWKKVAGYNFGDPGRLSPDGAGGFWLTVTQFPAAPSMLLHYSGGRLTPVALPGISDPGFFLFGGMSRVPGTTHQLVIGNTTAQSDPVNSYGIILALS